MNYSITCLTNASKLGWCLVAQELLREEHNIMSTWYNPDLPLIPLTEYQKLRAEVQIGWSYTGKKLSKEEWIRYLNDRFYKKSSLISEGIGMHTQDIMNVKSYSVNLDEIK